MLKSDFLFYVDYIKYRNLNNKKILISKTTNSYLIGPKINLNFDEESFFKRIISNSIYSMKIYKKMFKKKSLRLINKYHGLLKDNQVVEILKKDNTVIIHDIIKVPGVKK